MGFIYRKATADDLNRIWDGNIADNPGDERWSIWKNEYVAYNQSGMAQTYVVLCDGEPVGEGTLLYSPACAAVGGRAALADAKKIANINALRIQKPFEGKGHISKLVHKMELDATAQGYSHLSIGVEARETRNLAIYLHWGYDDFILSEVEGGTLVLYYKKQQNSTPIAGMRDPHKFE